MGSKTSSVYRFILEHLFLSRLSAELDYYRILVIRVLTYLLVAILVVESIGALLGGFYAIGFVELACLAAYYFTLTKTKREPHVLGNLFILVFFAISIAAIFSTINDAGILFFMTIIPVLNIFFLGLKKASVWIFLIMMFFLGKTAIYYQEYGRLPWESNLFIFSIVVFVFCLLFTIAYEKTNQLVLKKLQEQAARDELTGIFNRRKFYEILCQEIEQYQRYGEPFSLAMLDIDHFKSVNDTYGHGTGDLVLRELVAVIKTNLRKADVLARYGGEEFVVLLPHTPVESARVAMEKTRRLIASHLFPQVSHCTVSIGITQYLQNEAVGTFMNRADIALYEAKARGRNRVVESV